MKKILILLICSFSSCFYAQQIMKIEDAEKKFKRDSIQMLYFDRIFSDEITDCFDVSPELFIVEWSKFGRALSKYFHENGFVWGKKTTATIEVYFDKDEKIELFFITIRDKEFPEDKYTKVFELINKFAREYKFTIDAKLAFTNAGSVTFYD